jgi:2-methylaconitate cis-trans-isomerase PrpF
LARAEAIRGAAAERVGLVKDRTRSAEENPNHPFLVVVSSPRTYVASDGSTVRENATDIVARAFFMQRMHKTFPASAALCLGVAMKIDGTIPAEMSRQSASHAQTIRIGHGAGVMDVEIEVEKTHSAYRVTRAAYARTARMILEGAVFIETD